VEEVFIKRRRKKAESGDESFSRRPPANRPPRTRAGGSQDS
jgi:hypothetical protein